nr:immunoglobulin light chain junction region [Macaca mulatta]
DFYCLSYDSSLGAYIF